MTLDIRDVVCYSYAVINGGETMYAVVATGGKQYKVSAGDRIKVEKLNEQTGESIELSEVLLVVDGEKVKVGQPKVKNAKVVAQVIGHGRGRKKIIFKKKKREKYRRKAGHRQEYTELEIKEIGCGGE